MHRSSHDEREAMSIGGHRLTACICRVYTGEASADGGRIREDGAAHQRLDGGTGLHALLPCRGGVNEGRGEGQGAT